MSEKMMDERTAADLRELVLSRGNVYGLLARCYQSEIDASFARELADGFSFQSEDGLLCEEMDAMRQCVRAVDEGGIEQLAVTFDRVFFGMGPLTARHAFPYESVYTSGAGLLMQEAYGETKRVYRENGLAKDESFTEPEDHLAVQLSFMKTLCDRACAALEKRDEDAAAAALEEQRAFLDSHLLNWVGRFADDACVAAHEGFYVHLARFTARFLALDRDVVDDVLGDSL